MHSRTLLLAALLGLAGWTSASAEPGPPAFHAGETSRTMRPAEPRNWRGSSAERLAVTIWYPVDAAIAERPHDVGRPDRPVFYGHPVSPDAPLSPQRARYPLILLSHGTGGTANDLNWAAGALAEQGYIVAAVNHPGNNALEPMTWEGFNLWWERARDVSDMLDGLLADPMIGAHIDRDRIGAMGFSLGGCTVLELAGARTNLVAFRAFCGGPRADAICHPPEMARIVNAAPSGGEAPPAVRASLGRSGDSYRDPRIKAVFAIAPAVGQAFDAHGMRDVAIPVAIMAGDADVHVPPRTNAAYVAGLLGTAPMLIHGAAHYSFLPLCGPAALEQFPDLCRDGAGGDRRAIHGQAIEAASAFFARTLGPGQQ